MEDRRWFTDDLKPIYCKNLDEVVERYIDGYSKTHSILNDELVSWCEELGMESINKRATRKELIQALYGAGITNKQIFDRFKGKAFGLEPSYYTDAFKLSAPHRKKMGEAGFLKINYTVNTKVFTGTYADVPYYDPEQFFTLTAEDIERWKDDNIRGYKKRKERELKADAEN